MGSQKLPHGKYGSDIYQLIVKALSRTWTWTLIWRIQIENFRNDRKILEVWLYLTSEGIKVGCFILAFNIQRERERVRFLKDLKSFRRARRLVLTQKHSHIHITLSCLFQWMCTQIYTPIFKDNKCVQYSKTPELLEI